MYGESMCNYILKANLYLQETKWGWIVAGGNAYGEEITLNS